jgi:lipooligosaccharide transport system permease protein
MGPDTVIISRRPFPSVYAGNIRSVWRRGLEATKTTNALVIASGFFEPVFYLLSLGIGFGVLVGPVQTSTGMEVSYAAYIAPALLAVAAMNGAIFDSTWNVFFKLNFQRLYEGMLQTSLGPLDVAVGEITLALMRGALYASGFLIVMQLLGLVLSPWAWLALPAVVLIALTFAAIGMTITSYLTTFQQMSWVNFALLPLFLFSGTFFPLDVYPEPAQWIVQVLPLWHGVELLRGLTTGAIGLGLLGHVAYFVVLGGAGVILATRRLTVLFFD